MINKKKAEAVYKQSVKILKKVQLKSGGCLATPRGERYPYIYPRDNAFCVLGFLSAGLLKEARRALSFVFNAQLDHGAFPQRLDIKGKDASYKPIQVDGTGLTLYAFAEYIKKSKDLIFLERHWPRVEGVVDYIKKSFHEDKDLIYTPNSIHEFPPTEQGLEIWANSTCCAALREISGISKLIKEDTKDWEMLSNKIREGIVRHMWNSRVNSFVKNIRVAESSSVKVEVDVAEYSPAYFNLLSDDDKRIKSTVKRIESELWNKNLGGICRYPKREGRHNGGYGPWPHFTLMIVRHFINLKNKKKADKYLKWVLKTSYNNDLPEHISTKNEFEEYVNDFTEAGLLRKDRMMMIRNARKHPMFKKGIAYITIPLAWPHAEFIMAWNLYKKTFLK